jgi:hypothetical protein
MYLIRASSRPKSLYWARQEGPIVNPETSEFDFRLGKLDIKEPIIYKSMNGQKLQDVIGSSGGGILFSERLKTFLESNGITGLEYYPVTLNLKKSPSIRYYLIRSNNICNDLDSSAAIERDNTENPSMPRYYGYTLNMNSVNCNFTRPKSTLFLLCDESTKNCLETEFSGFIFENIDSLEII